MTDVAERRLDRKSSKSTLKPAPLEQEPAEPPKPLSEPKRRRSYKCCDTSPRLDRNRLEAEVTLLRQAHYRLLKLCDLPTPSQPLENFHFKSPASIYLSYDDYQASKRLTKILCVTQALVVLTLLLTLLLLHGLPLLRQHMTTIVILTMDSLLGLWMILKSRWWRRSVPYLTATLLDLGVAFQWIPYNSTIALSLLTLCYLAWCVRVALVSVVVYVLLCPLVYLTSFPSS